jgi:hypothetical protein
MCKYIRPMTDVVEDAIDLQHQRAQIVHQIDLQIEQLRH